MNVNPGGTTCSTCGNPLPRGLREEFCPVCSVRGALELAANEPPLPAIIRYVGDYELLEPIARGGMGVVYRARQRSLGRTVAVKMILAGEFASPEARARFQAEARAAAALRHPNIVAIHEVGDHEGQPYYSMELVEGCTLAELVRDRPLPAERAAGYVQAIALAVHHAHTQGTLHRDLKPSNVLIDPFDQPRVTDFGLARQLGEASDLTQSGQVLGSPSFTSPEQARGEHTALTPASDVYSLGAILYHLLTARPPFQGDTVQAVLRQVEHNDPIAPRRLNPSVPVDLETIALKCLEKAPARRYASAKEFADDLGRFIAGESVIARPVGPAGRAVRWAQRRPGLASLWAGLALALALGFAGVSWQWQRAEHQATRAGRIAEDEARQRARTEMLVSRLELQRAEDALRAGDAGTALAYLARQARSRPTNAAAAERLLGVLEQRAFTLPLLPPLRHDGGINDAGFSHDGRFVVTASRDKTARVWDARTGQPVTPPLRHEDDVAVAQFNADGSKIVTGCADLPDRSSSTAVKSADTLARIWDARTGELLHTLRHDGAVPAAQFSPDGLRVVTGSSDRTARVWDAATGRPITEPLRDGGAISVVLFSPDGRRVLTAGSSGTVRLWDADSGQPVGAAMKHPRLVMAAAFSPDGTRVATACFDGKARVWDVTTGKLASEPLEHENVVTCVAFSPDGQRVASGCRAGKARLWDAATGEALGRPFEHRTWMSVVQFTPDGRGLLTVSEDNSASLHDLASGRLLVEPVRHGRVIKAARFSPDGQRLLTASADSTAQIWDIRPGRAASLVLRHSAAIQLVQFDADGARLAVASADGTVRVWDARRGAPLTPPLAHGTLMTALQFSRDGRRLLTASRQGARVWDCGSGKALVPLLQPGGVVADARLSPDERRILTASWSGRIQLYDAASGDAVGPALELPPRVWHAEFSPDGRWFGACSDAGVAQVWDAESFQPAGAALRHEGGSGWISFSPDSRKVVTCGSDQTARVWDVRTGRPLLAPLKHSAAVRCASFSPDGRRILTASSDNTARLWNAETGQPLGEPMRHGAEVRYAAFSANGQRVASASDDQTARVWDAHTGWPISEPLAHGGRLTFVAWSPDSQRLATASGDGAARIWDLTPAPVPVPAWLPDLAEAVAGRRLTDTGTLELLPTDRLWALKDQLANAAGGDSMRWARWFFADPVTRPISPSAGVTAAEVAKLRQTKVSFEEPPLSQRIPPRDPLTSSNCIDLSAHYNAALTDDWHGRQWPGNNLAVLRAGQQTLAGVPFDVRGIVQLSGLALRASVPDFPETVAGIDVSRKVRRLHFLQATSWGLYVTNGAPIGRYVVHYADGREQTIPILNGIDTREWQVGTGAPNDLKRAVVAWQGRNARGIPVHLFLSTWENPQPETEVESIDFISEMTQSAPFLIALTAK